MKLDCRASRLVENKTKNYSLISIIIDCNLIILKERTNIIMFLLIVKDICINMFSDKLKFVEF